MFKRLMPTMEKIAKHSKIGLLIDSYEMGDQNWTNDMPSYFEKSANIHCGHSYQYWQVK